MNIQLHNPLFQCKADINSSAGHLPQGGEQTTLKNNKLTTECLLYARHHSKHCGEKHREKRVYRLVGKMDGREPLQNRRVRNTGVHSQSVTGGKGEA